FPSARRRRCPCPTSTTIHTPRRRAPPPQPARTSCTPPTACAASYQRSMVGRYMLRTGVVLVLTALVACAGSAAASEPEVFGLGSEESAVAGASAARVHDFSAGYYDPAGLVLARRAEASVGVVGFGAQLPLPDGRTFHMSDRVGVLVGAATP